MIKNIFVDLDGVLADFDFRFKELWGKSCREIGDVEMWKRITHYEQSGNTWFLDLPKMPDADKLWKFINNIPNVTIYILTATGHDIIEHGKQKRLWVKKHFKVSEKDIFVVPKSEAKAVHADAESILIDDAPRSIDAWVGMGGIGILYTSLDDTIEKLKELTNEK